MTDIIAIFKVKGKKDEKDKENDSKKKMTEIEELKQRLAKTEEALNKLVQATTQEWIQILIIRIGYHLVKNFCHSGKLSKKMPEEELEKIFGVSFAENLGPKEPIAEDESECPETEEESLHETVSTKSSNCSSKSSNAGDLEVEDLDPATSSEAEQASEDEPQDRF